MKSLIATLGAVLLLAACAQQPVVIAPAVESPVARVVDGDPQHCSSQAECTTKTSRTLLFVFDYAAAGGALVQRQQRWLFTPADAPQGEWPAIRIQLAEPLAGHFTFSAECQAQSCRYSAAELLRVYRSYLAGEACSLQLASAVHGCRLAEDTAR
ncbi:putative periplasmic lipoprotein [Aquipseudomonas ullengensis]|uniref:Lipoprotein n=1 Tax=Aquipseudomonas ullengensis TaxID=2759166 RepID=A0A7W4LIT4_9GAMM|nr:hypothetical protein [Pseudomonas ullengensis]MBB2493896.1 hypothetical protein [Pseudomonas ullengensis]